MGYVRKILIISDFTPPLTPLYMYLQLINELSPLPLEVNIFNNCSPTYISVVILSTSTFKHKMT